LSVDPDAGTYRGDCHELAVVAGSDEKLVVVEVDRQHLVHFTCPLRRPTQQARNAVRVVVARPPEPKKLVVAF